MKYMGSKRSILKYILPYILHEREGYDHLFVEPFVGGANVASTIRGNVWGNDLNPYLIALYKALQTGWTPLEPHEITNELYIDVRDNKDKYPKHLVGYLGFMFSFGAVFFGGFVGNVNDRKCRNRDRIGEGYRNILQTKRDIRHIKFTCMSYLDMVIPSGSIIYCDPPYKNTHGYNNESFNHIQFYDWCISQKQNNSFIYISEYDMPKPFKCVWEKQINGLLSKKGKNKKPIERLYTI